MFRTIVFLGCYLILCQPIRGQHTAFLPGQVWTDTDGKPIEAHGGGILRVGQRYYWYGENHQLGHGNKTGISCYSSTDLLNWKNEGVVFPKTQLPVMFQDTGACERPKVIYSPKTRQYVMWMHLASNRHREADAGVAIAESPTGPFRFLGHQRPIAYNYGYTGGSGRTWGNNPDEEIKGNTFRDMTLYHDDTGRAYVLYASEDNATLYIAELNDAFTDIKRPAIEGKTWTRALVGEFREAPAIFKHLGTYYLLTSGTTGWNPNPAVYHTATAMLGPWIKRGDPCVGAERETTFRSQPTFVIPAPGKAPNQFIYLGDRWNGNELEKSTYVWLPFTVDNTGKLTLRFFGTWTLASFNTNSPTK